MESHFGDDLKAIRPGMGRGDVLVVAPGRAFAGPFEAVLEQQLVRRQDASAALRALGAELKALAGTPAFDAYADAAVERIHSVLCQGMSLSFGDNGLTDYLKAQFTSLCGRCAASLIGADAVVEGGELIVCEVTGGIPVVDATLTRQNILALPREGVTVVSASYGRKVTGETVALGQAGSELTACLIGAALGATVRFYVDEATIGGVPARLTYDEASQRFASGYPLYPPAIFPARKAGLTLEVGTPEGVRFVIAPPENVEKGIKGVLASDPMSLITVFGTGLQGSIGISSALFGVLARSGVNIHFIAQTLSEYSITFAVRRSCTEAAEEAVRSLISDPSRSDLSFDTCPVVILSVFGQGMRNVPGISGRVYSALGNAGINVIAASQGGEELSISIVVEEADAARALETLQHHV